MPPFPFSFMYKSLTTLLAATLFTFGAASCSQMSKTEEKTKNSLGEATKDTAVVARTGQTAGDAAATAADKVGDAASATGAAVANAFDMTKAKLADVKLPEVNLPGISVRGDADYQVYSLEEGILFDTNKAAIKPSAAAAIKQITGSITQRFAGKDVRVMGFADSRGDKAYNFKLAQERAEAVKSYLVSTGKMEAGKVSTESFGEAAPVASNATAEGRQENRRVEIAVRVK